MKRSLYVFFISTLLLLSFTVCTWAANSIVMIGQGVTKDEAIQNAIRNAVESATGVFVYSTSEVQNFKLVKDQIVTASKGYVKDFKILSESKSDGVVFVTLNVSVDTVAIKSAIKRDMKTTTYEDALKDYATMSSLVERNKKYAAILKSISSRTINDLYKVNFSGYEIINAGITSADVILKFNIAINNFLWDAYYETLILIGSSWQHNDNHIIMNYRVVEDDYARFDVIGKRIYFHTDFNDFILKPRQVELTYTLPEGRFKTQSYLVYDRYIEEYNERNVISIPVRITTVNKMTDHIAYYMGNNGYEFKIRHTFKNINDIKKIPFINVALKDVTQKNITYEWD